MVLGFTSPWVCLCPARGLGSLLFQSLGDFVKWFIKFESVVPFGTVGQHRRVVLSFRLEFPEKQPYNSISNRNYRI